MSEPPSPDSASAELLQEIDAWRCSLAVRLASRRRRITEDELNLAVGRTVNDYLFQQICDARGYSFPAPKSQLLKTPQRSDLFAHLNVRILGQVYEQFLGKTIRLSADRKTCIEERPEIKKAGGVFYTPDYIVDAIVDRALGRWLKDKSVYEAAGRTKTWRVAKKARPLKIFDPACGGGAFLVGAYEYLLAWYRDAYVADGPSKHRSRIEQTSNGEWRLSHAERKRILCDHLFGADIDERAVEVTRLTLGLAWLDGEPQSERQLALFDKQQREPPTLPDLTANIRCEDSLAPSEDETEYDVVIGNPPYGAALTPEQRKQQRRRHALGTTDTAALMMMQAHCQTTPGGVNGFIVPKPFTYSSNWRRVRERLRDELVEIIDVGKAWRQVKLEQVIYIAVKGSQSDGYQSSIRQGRDFQPLGVMSKSACDDFGFLLNGISPDELRLARKIAGGGLTLGQLTANTRGAMLQAQLRPRAKGRTAIGGKQLNRYQIEGAKGRLPAGFQPPDQAIVQPRAILVQNIVAHIRRPSDHIKIIAAVADDDQCAPIAILDTVNQLTNQSSLSSYCLLGLLHSRLINWFVYRFIFAKAVRTMHFDGPVSNRIPIRSFDGAAGRKRHDQIVEVVLRLQAAHGEKVRASGKKLAKLREQIAADEAQLNHIVYEHYGLNTQERERIEAANP